uniref:Uncharacterized protein n=1 Tax=Wuchereria bancrofti TaxID=6293 RepID=A0AAF5RY33_WUCBA
MVGRAARSIKRSRTHLALRFMFRINPSFYCFGFQCILSTIDNFNSIDEFSRLLRKNQILIKKKSFISRFYNIIFVSIAPPTNITEYQYKILRPKDFLVKCPICAIKSFFGWFDFIIKFHSSISNLFSLNYSKHMIKNIGECRNCARYCDFEDEHDETDFCRLHELLREKLGIKMDESNELHFIDSSDLSRDLFLNILFLSFIYLFF